MEPHGAERRGAATPAVMGFGHQITRSTVRTGGSGRVALKSGHDVSPRMSS